MAKERTPFTRRVKAIGGLHSCRMKREEVDESNKFATPWELAVCLRFEFGHA